MGVNDMYYVDLENDDILPSRKDTFYLKFPEDWKTQDVVKLFEKFAPEVRVSVSLFHSLDYEIMYAVFFFNLVIKGKLPDFSARLVELLLPIFLSFQVKLKIEIGNTKNCKSENIDSLQILF